MSGSIFSIGYGNRSFSDFCRLLKANGIAFVVDVRSYPFSKYKTEFNRPTLSSALNDAGFRYLYLGDALGGIPLDGERTAAGKPDYQKISKKSTFVAGLDRLETAVRKGLTVSLMCGEATPDGCHRVNLIGKQLLLSNSQIDVLHIVKDETIVKQSALQRKQLGMFHSADFEVLDGSMAEAPSPSDRH